MDVLVAVTPPLRVAAFFPDFTGSLIEVSSLLYVQATDLLRAAARGGSLSGLIFSRRTSKK